MATVYLIHFDRPYIGQNGRGRVQHYLGYTRCLRDRTASHRGGYGANLMRVVTEAGIEWKVVRTWQGSRTLERRLKDRKNAPRLCPICNPKSAKKNAKKPKK